MSWQRAGETVPPADKKEASNVDIKRRRITGSILAVLTAAVVACGSMQGASGKPGSGGGGGDSYLTADGSYGVGARDATSVPGGIGGGPAADGSGPSLQP
jgi:hypothetical protein